LASITTDAGAYHLLDIRTDSRSMPTIVDTSKSDLYTHAYMRDTNVLLFGYGDGTISQFDLRVNKMYVGISQTQPRSRSRALSLSRSHTVTTWRSVGSYHDSFMRQIGDLEFSSDGSTLLVTGTPEFTIWQIDDNTTQVVQHRNMADDFPGIARPMLEGGGYKTAGHFMPGLSRIIMSDSLGTVAVYDVQSPIEML